MGYKENNLIKRVLLSAKANNQRLVRINSGMGWISEKSGTCYQTHALVTVSWGHFIA